MEALWDRSPQTASQLTKALRRKTGWAVNTVRTLLTRLAEKKAVTVGTNAEGIREFAPAAPRDAYVRAESESFMQRVFRGAAKPLLLHFASHSKLTADEVNELKRLLDQSLKNKS